MNKGGYREGAGRKPKANELELIELLSPLDGIALEALKKGVIAGDFAYIKLFLAYRFGTPKPQQMSKGNEAVMPLWFNDQNEYNSWLKNNNQ